MIEYWTKEGEFRTDNMDTINYDLLHRENGPAYIRSYPSGKIWHEMYYIDGKEHREDGPSDIEYNINGAIYQKYYELNSFCYEKEQWEFIVKHKQNGDPDLWSNEFEMMFKLTFNEE